MQSASTNCKSKSEQQDKADTFPHKLFKFLRDVELYNASHVASWAPDGRSFQIHIPSEFISMAEPRWFSFNKYSSFQRQLNIYGFRPVRDGTKKNCYYHEHFRRECDHLLHRIHRIPGKKDRKFHLLANATGSELDSSSQIISRRTSIAAADPIALRLTTNIANTDTSNTADCNIINVGELIAAMMNTNRNIPALSVSQAVTNSIMREAHLANQFSREFNYAGFPAIEHRSIRPSVNQSIPYIGNIPDLGSIGHMLNSPLTPSLSNAEAALAVLLHRGNLDAEVSFSQLLQSTTSRSNVNMSHLPINREPLVPSQHIMGYMPNQRIPVTSSIEADRNNLVQLQSLLDSATLSTLLQLSQLPMQGTSIDTLVRILSSGGTVQERYDFSQLTLPQSSVLQQQTRRDSIIESMPNTATDVAQNVTSIANDRIVGIYSNDATDDDDRKLPGNQGGSNQIIIATQPQHNDAVNTSTTSELLTIANNILEMYRSNR